jgi:hypothetical protein
LEIVLVTQNANFFLKACLKGLYMMISTNWNIVV